MAQKPSIPKGTRDFTPAQMARRNYIFDTVRRVFTLYGYSPIETPSMETLATLMGKYGEEGDKLLFKILNSGDFLRGVDLEGATEGTPRLASQLCEKGLRYDLTVPFARFVTMHRNELAMPFRRYQMQPVWRADRPQKGRYREFYQCDVDIVGSDSLLNEAELLQMLDDVYAALGLRVAIKLNNRKVLAGMAQVIGAPDKLVDITVAIDKIDKVGLDAVKAELAGRGLPDEAVERLVPMLTTVTGSVDERLERLEELLQDSEEGLLGIRELRTVIDAVRPLGLRAELDLDTSLARGLNYYTGTIIEVKALDAQIGSVSGGGRYDNLTGVFGMPGLSGVGVSFGADRIYDALDQLGLFPDGLDVPATALVLNMGETAQPLAMQAARSLRRAGIPTELFPDTAKMQKQLKRADTLGIPYVVIIGDDEASVGEATLKHLPTGKQQRLPLADLPVAIAEGC